VADDPAGGLSDDELASLILDEAFVRGASVKEPAAAERGTTGPIVAPPRPPRLRPSHPPRERSALTWLRRRLATIIIVVLIAAMVAGSVGPLASRRSNSDDQDRASARETQQPPPSPFAASPAANFADGDRGLVLPAATALGDMSTTDVALALHGVRRAIKTANLDDATVGGSSVGAYVDVVGPETRARLEAVLAGAPTDDAVTTFVTRFPAEAAVLSDHPPKVSGVFTSSADPDGGVRITTRHVFAYAVQPAVGEGEGEVVTEVVVVRRDTEWRVVRSESGVAKPELISAEVATSGHCLVDSGGYVWPRFLTPEAPARIGTAVALATAWRLTERLGPTTDCFLPLPT